MLGIKNGSNPKSALTGRKGQFQDTAGDYLGAIDTTQLNVNYLAPGQKGVPLPTSASEPSDIFETDFTPGQRNIFRQSFQKRADVSVTKTVRIGERYSALYSFNVFNVTNTSSFDVPNNSSSIGAGRVKSTTGSTNLTEQFGQVVTGPTAAAESTAQSTLYTYPTVLSDGATTSTFGAVRNTIGGSRIIEMSLHLNF